MEIFGFCIVWKNAVLSVFVGYVYICIYLAVFKEMRRPRRRINNDR